MTYERIRGTLERKIFFYRVDLRDEESGRPIEFDPLPALREIEELPFTNATNDDQGRYDFDLDGNALCLVNHGQYPNPSVRFCRVRRTGLPQLEQEGQITDLLLSPDTGLLEATHIVFFPNSIVGAEYNHFGPRVSRLGSYLHEKSKGAVPDVRLRPLLRVDIAAQLDRLTEVRWLEMSINRSYIDEIRRADDSLADAFDAASRAIGNTEIVVMTLKIEKQSRVSIRDSIVHRLKNLINQDSAHNGNIFQNSDRIQVRGKVRDTDRVETIDLLKDAIVSTKGIVRLSERGRALNTESAFQSIHQAYSELEEDILNAPDISP